MSQYEDRFTREQAAEDGERLAHSFIVLVMTVSLGIITVLIEAI